jgi:hypothetical protein
MVAADFRDEISPPVVQEKKIRRRELDLDAEALAALEEARDAAWSGTNRSNEKSGHSPKCG